MFGQIRFRRENLCGLLVRISNKLSPTYLLPLLLIFCLSEEYFPNKYCRLLSLWDVTAKFRVIAMLVIVNFQTLFYA
jgi:hypothetical protein